MRSPGKAKNIMGCVSRLISVPFCHCERGRSGTAGPAPGAPRLAGAAASSRPHRRAQTEQEGSERICAWEMSVGNKKWYITPVSFH